MDDAKTPPQDGDYETAVVTHRGRNFISLAAREIFFQLGWIFKTESIVMSTFAMKLGATPGFLGLFPFISRIGKCVVQMIAGEWMAPRAYKRMPIFVASLFFSLVWLGLGLFLLVSGQAGPRMLWVFLAVYALAWFSLGVVMVGANTLKGKLIRPDLRGRLLAVSQLVGGVLALGMVALLNYLMNRDASFVNNFGIVFVIAGAFFLLSSITLCFLFEPPLASPPPAHKGVRYFIRTAYALLRENENYRRIAGIQFLQELQWTCLMFYASFGRECMGSESWGKTIAVFLLLQSLSQTFASIVVGWVADKLGNRFVIRVLCVVLTALPFSAIVMSQVTDVATPLRWTPIFILIGCVLPLTQISQNYLLEVTPVERHASYLGIANGLPILTSVTTLIVGPLIGYVGHSHVFAGLGFLMLGSVYYSLRLQEPRGEQ